MHCISDNRSAVDYLKILLSLTSTRVQLLATCCQCTVSDIVMKVVINRAVMCVQDLILQALVYSLHGFSSLLCIAWAACQQGITHCFAFTMRRFAAGSTPPFSASAPPPYPPSSSAAVPPTKPSPPSSSLIESSLEHGLADLWGTRSSSPSDTGGLEAVATLTHQISCLTKQNCWLSRHLEVSSTLHFLYVLTCFAVNLLSFL